MKLTCGTSNRPLGEVIAAHVNLLLAECYVRRFLSGEAVERISAADRSSVVAPDTIGVTEAVLVLVE
jgi:hypothetical protein|tara:strand:+ start:732 stop:932 length:201 start_codon:yes stop_codon:yes gene_type:complete